MSGEERPGTCDACRERAFEYRRGELSERDREQIDEHLETCDACSEYFARLETLLDSARDLDPVSERGETDQMFEAITDEIDRREEGREIDEPESSRERSGPGRSSWTRHAGVAAAALFAGFVLGWLLSQFLATDRASAPVAEQREAAAGSPERVAEKDDSQKSTETEGTSAPSDAASERAFAQLREVESTGTGRPQESSKGEESGKERRLRVFASPGAEWSMTGEGDSELRLEKGRILVEFLPGETDSLRVRAPEFDVRVVGTVFFVSADREAPRAGVLAGKIEVEPKTGEPVQVDAGRELRSNFETRSMPESRRETLGTYVDLDGHKRELARRKSAAASDSRRKAPAEGRGAPRSERETGDGGDRGEEPSPRANAPATRDDGSTPSESHDGGGELAALRGRADRAAARGNHREAATRYREFLDRAPPDHPGVGPVHLDLANLYIHRLDEPSRAVSHLKTYVRRWPNDVATPSVRDELCRITRNLERREPLCP